MRYTGNGKLIFKAESISVKYDVREIVTRGLREHRGSVEGDPSAFIRLVMEHSSAKLQLEDGRLLDVLFPRVNLGDSRINLVGSGPIREA